MRKIQTNAGSVSISGNLGLKNISGAAINPARKEDIDSLISLIEDRSTGGLSALTAEYKSPDDFSVAYTSATTITLSALPISITDSSQVMYIVVVPVTGSVKTYINGVDGISLTVSSNVITIAGVTTPFTTGDVYQVGLNGQSKAYDPSTNSIMNSDLNPVWNRYTDVETLVTAQDLTAAYADFGAEIDMRGYNRLGVYIVTDVNSSLNVLLKALAKHTSAGVDEFEVDGIGVKTLWTTGASDSKLYYEFDCGTIPFIQLQAIAGTVGATAGDLTIYIDKKWRE